VDRDQRQARQRCAAILCLCPALPRCTCRPPAAHPLTAQRPHRAGVDLLRDGRDDTYWQSDGPQPHLVNISFQKKVFLSAICLYTDYKLDESYTPQRLSIRAGSCWSDLREIKVVDINEPQGWVTIPLAPPEDPQ
jgi:anaphase-promoting complex subunit 10